MGGLLAFLNTHPNNQKKKSLHYLGKGDLPHYMYLTYGYHSKLLMFTTLQVCELWLPLTKCRFYFAPTTRAHCKGGIWQLLHARLSLTKSNLAGQSKPDHKPLPILCTCILYRLYQVLWAMVVYLNVHDISTTQCHTVLRSNNVMYLLERVDPGVPYSEGQ